MVSRVEKDISDFDRIASALKVKSICNQFWSDVPIDSSISDAKYLMGDLPDTPSRVVDSAERTLGFLWLADLDDGSASVFECMEQLAPADFLAADTTILDALDILSSGERGHYYVLERNEVVGYLTYSDFFKPLGRLALLAVALETEDLALKLCRLPSLAEECWSKLPIERQKKAAQFYELRHDKAPAIVPGEYRTVVELIGCTYLTDKGNMIWKAKLATGSRREILGVFQKLKELRNMCAHPGSERRLLAEFSRERLIETVNAAKRMNDSLRQSYEQHLLDQFR